MKQITVQEIKRLEKIISRTKKRRIKNKLIGRLSNGTFDCFYTWLNDEEAHKTIDAVAGGIRMPSHVELIERYGKG